MKQLESLATLGPSRRAMVTVVEMVLQPEPVEFDRLAAIVDQLQHRLPLKLASLGLELQQDLWTAILDRPEEMARLAGFACQTALALQQKAGHEVKFEDFFEDRDPLTNQGRFRFIFEHDDPTTGEWAGDLAMRILSETCSELKWTAVFNDATEPLESSIEAMLESARQLVAPQDVLDLIAAAEDRGIPAVRLEREPYEPVKADFRVVRNGLVMLGQSCYRVLLDGLFCIERPGPGFNLMKDRRMVWRLLTEMGVSNPFSGMDMFTCMTISRARRIARRIGYPVRVWPLQRDSEAADGWLVRDEAGLCELFDCPKLQNQTLMIEPEPKGPGLDLLFANGRLLYAMREGYAIETDPSVEELAGRVARAVNTGLLLLRFNPREAKSEKGDDGASAYLLTHLDPAPSLRHLFPGDDKHRREALECFLDWVIPPGAPCRIPVIAVTGTNGKTTTTTMLSRIAQAAGRRVGMAQTGGVYIDGELQEFGDLSGFPGHGRIFENREVDMAVLETARGGLVCSGFIFDRCDVAVCTNVTADHLGQYGIETVEQMAVIKRSVLERAVKAVVLNGDDEHCLAMAPFLSDKIIYLSTFSNNPQLLRSRTHAGLNVVNVEEIRGQNWIVLHEQEDDALPVIAVDAIPATFKGHARHNISNAMHAIAAARAAGLDIEAIISALSEFEMSFESVPGRLNLHDNGRYHVLMDYAHNADGIRQLVRFTDQFPCTGRRILRFGVSPDAADSAVLQAADAAAGHFDYYICAGIPRAGGAGHRHPEMLKQGLMAKGVPMESITMTTDPDEAFNYPVSLCGEGDLLVLITSRFFLAKTWQQILATR